MRLNPGAPDYHPSDPYICTYTCFFPLPPPGIPVPFPPPFPPKQTPFPPPFPAMQTPFPACPPKQAPFTPLPLIKQAPFSPFPAPSAPFLPFPAPPAPPTQPPCSFNAKVLWVPKEVLRNQNRFLTVDPVWPTNSQSKPTDLEFGTAGALIKGRTTIMIKNIPVKFTRAMLIQMLDQHCAVQEKEVESAYDFVYVPIDFRTGLSRGFAFVNFTTQKAAEKAYEQIHHHKWTVFKTHKIAHVCYAFIQGKEALVARFKLAQFWCHTDEFLPAIFAPPRNGMTSLPPPEVISRRY